MKATFFLVFALILNNQVLFSQSNVSIGIIGGPTAAKFRDGFEFIPKQWMVGFSTGAAIRIGLTQYTFFQTEIGYERKGFSLHDMQWTGFVNAEPSEKFTERQQFNYALFTPTIGVKTIGKLHFEGSLGLFWGYLTQVKAVFAIDPIDLPASAFQPDMSRMNLYDFGATSRLGLGLDCGKKLSLKLNAMGNLGFSKVYKPISLIGGDIFQDDKTISLGLQLGVFYKI